MEKTREVSQEVRMETAYGTAYLVERCDEQGNYYDVYDAEHNKKGEVAMGNLPQLFSDVEDVLAL